MSERFTVYVDFSEIDYLPDVCGEFDGVHLIFSVDGVHSSWVDSETLFTSIHLVVVFRCKDIRLRIFYRVTYSTIPFSVKRSRSNVTFSGNRD